MNYENNLKFICEFSQSKQMEKLKNEIQFLSNEVVEDTHSNTVTTLRDGIVLSENIYTYIKTNPKHTRIQLLNMYDTKVEEIEDFRKFREILRVPDSTIFGWLKDDRPLIDLTKEALETRYKEYHRNERRRLKKLAKNI